MTKTITQVLVEKRWMKFAFPEDVEQTIWLAIALHLNETEHRQALELEYQLKILRYQMWERRPIKKPTKPKQLRPSRAIKAKGYRKNHNVK